MSIRVTRREALGTVAGAVTLAMVPAAAQDRLAELYAEALVIDALSFGKEWQASARSPTGDPDAEQVPVIRIARGTGYIDRCLTSRYQYSSAP